MPDAQKKDCKAAAKKMNISKIEAENTKTFVIEHQNVIETNLYDFVMKSIDETTSPVGVMPRIHVRHESFSCSYGLRNRVNNNEGKYEVWSWGVSGNNSSFIEEFETREEAENYIFQLVFKYDFISDDQRDTSYYFSIQEAESEYIKTYAANRSIDIEVSKSIFRHQKLANDIIEKRKEKRRAEAEQKKKRIKETAYLYANLIQVAEKESYKETAKKLSHAIGTRIESAVFHEAVKIVRNKTIK